MYKVQLINYCFTHILNQFASHKSLISRAHIIDFTGFIIKHITNNIHSQNHARIRSTDI